MACLQERRLRPTWCLLGHLQKIVGGFEKGIGPLLCYERGARDET
jgi:hypothetical protein